VPAPRTVAHVLLCGLVLAVAACSAPQPAPPAAPEVVDAAAVSRPPPDPVREPVVVLDAGHNGGNGAHVAEIGRQVPDGRGGTKACNTTGTQTAAGYAEHAFTFDVTARVAKRLTAKGVRVVLTRTDDAGVGPCVDERAAVGQRAGADAVVSIHADGSAPANRGYHVAYSDPPVNDVQSGPAKVLATALRDSLHGAGFPDSNYIGRGGLSPRRDLAGLNLATRPTALVECANMRHAAEAALVSTPAGRDRYAAGIAGGILAFLGR